ncbi:MAG: hypothetical protein COV07_04010 [Candidatus Vogelbacteria bacterium CG10_big_fil_rev_8_21_14_0_10_45_14]|uniref:Phage holin family protein n=1 Tax=Candidatus Vogelbacteria bacterium CG10_big_fil_rev_8_21_14_0_10_45_14 TaxID=1975042 RepID=A0A2H0RKF5_9BACT|nr:MAG: hypothetical protein COV07_04010 [Candidatus Vogelbacteria bacterium CG10_big_fil_rev_8_21_14_0_10_45_14]
MRILARWFVSAASILLVAYLVPGIEVSGIYIALVVAVLLGIANTFVRPVLFILTLPITILTLGLFTLVINGIVFWWLASFVQGFQIDGFWYAVLGALLVSMFSSLGNRYIVDLETRSEDAKMNQVI